ncbi:hypothetical protein B0J13DRAFT_128799 [Dactylonectria estremocensis]|uniref:Uncharacterized protein n=1 Tax=Dactylonectria estremocensis TaxID=1079267 RepID=A0A9P9FEU4_9HYPO|nr:hypothetical protein B0J13DRAFT_128799 [Dactylonectria estremocensis]
MKAKWTCVNLDWPIWLRSIFRHLRLGLKPSKYTSFLNCAGGELLMMSVPQLEIHPFEMGTRLPAGVQKSTVVLQWPQKLQHDLSGHELRLASLTPEAGLDVPGFVGPHLALAMGAGIGVVPLLRHILRPDCRLLHPSHPQVFLFHASRLAVVMAFAAAILAHQSPDWTV